MLKIEFASKEKKRFQVFDRLIKRPSNVKRRGNGKSDVLWSLVKGRFPLSKYFYYFSRVASLNLSDFHRCRRSRKKDTEIFLPVSKPKRWTDFRYPDQIGNFPSSTTTFHHVLLRDSTQLSSPMHFSTTIENKCVICWFLSKRKCLKFVKDATCVEYFLNSSIRKYK